MHTSFLEHIIQLPRKSVSEFVERSWMVKNTSGKDQEIVSDDAGNSETLTPQGNGMYRTNTLKGVEGRTYTLIVNTENQAYTAKAPCRSLYHLILLKWKKL